MHGNSDDDSCIDNRQDEIAVLERFVAVVGIAIEEEANMIGIRQEEGDLIVVIIVIDGGRAVEVDVYVCGVESEDGSGFWVGLLCEIRVEGVEGW